MASPSVPALGHEADLQHAIAVREFSEMVDARLDDAIGDELLRLHPLMELQASRLTARVDARGEPILLADQDRGCWDALLIRRGLAALACAEALLAAPASSAEAGPSGAPGPSAEAPPLGPYTLQAAIAACHVRAADFAGTDWPRIAALYAALLRVAPSPVVALNRAVAVGMAYGPTTVLELVDALRAAPELAGYHLLPAVRGDLLEKMGERDAARAEFERAADLAGNARERALLQLRARKCRATDASAAALAPCGR